MNDNREHSKELHYHCARIPHRSRRFTRLSHQSVDCDASWSQSNQRLHKPLEQRLITRHVSSSFPTRAQRLCGSFTSIPNPKRDTVASDVARSRSTQISNQHHSQQLSFYACKLRDYAEVLHWFRLIPIPMHQDREQESGRINNTINDFSSTLTHIKLTDYADVLQWCLLQGETSLIHVQDVR